MAEKTQKVTTCNKEMAKFDTRLEQLEQNTCKHSYLTLKITDGGYMCYAKCSKCNKTFLPPCSGFDHRNEVQALWNSMQGIEDKPKKKWWQRPIF